MKERVEWYAETTCCNSLDIREVGTGRVICTITSEDDLSNVEIQDANMIIDDHNSSIGKVSK